MTPTDTCSAQSTGGPSPDKGRPRRAVVGGWSDRGDAVTRRAGPIGHEDAADEPCGLHDEAVLAQAVPARTGFPGEDVPVEVPSGSALASSSRVRRLLVALARVDM